MAVRENISGSAIISRIKLSLRLITEDMPPLDLYMIATLLSSVAILAMGVCLLAVSVPRGVALRNYRISRRLLAVAYIILAVQSIGGAFLNQILHAEMATPILQAFLFTYALITLLNHNYMTTRRIVRQLLLIGAIIFIMVVNRCILPSPRPWLSYVVPTSYFALYVHYVWIFLREYRNYRRRADNFYAGNERSLLKWVLQIFVIAAIIGAMAGIITERNFHFWIFIIVYTLVYVYLAIRYISYVTLFYRIAPIVAEPKAAAGSREISEEHIRAGLGEWIARQGFIDPEVSLDTLAKELNTNPAYLSRHINSECGQNFRSWVNALRIGEAQKLLARHEELSYSDIGERVGILSISTFYRQFAAVAGMPPAEYRKRFGADADE